MSNLQRGQKSSHEYRGRYERSELQKTKLALPYAEARVEKYKRLLEEEQKNLNYLVAIKEALERENA